MTQTLIPSYDALIIPTVQSLELLGGSGTTDEIFAKVAELMELSSAVLDVPHGDTSQSEVEYRLAWSRTYLKKYGVLERTARGVWAISSKAPNLRTLDPKEIVRSVRDQTRSEPKSIATSKGGRELNVPKITAPDLLEDSPDEVFQWNIELHKTLLNLTPAAFERLIQRLLRESGFIQVEVTGKSGDGGIDGIGIARINGFLSFHVLFQAKRYQGSISPSQIRDFRGAMQGRTDKGLFITTGTFTRDAMKEATRDGAPPIDLIDGEHLVQRLKELQLGVKIQMVELVEIDSSWFEKL